MEYQNPLYKERNMIYEPDAVVDIPSEEVRIYTLKSAETTEEEIPAFSIERVKVHREKGEKSGIVLLLSVLISALAGFVLCGNFFGFTDSMYINEYIKSRMYGGFFANSAISFFSMVLWLVPVYLSGLCAVGQPFTVLTVTIKGLGLGITLSSFIAVYSLNGILAFAAFVLPSAVAGTLICVYLSNHSIKSSSRLLHYTKGRNADTHPESYFGSFTAKAIVCVIGCFISGIADSAITLLFSGIFVI